MARQGGREQVGPDDRQDGELVDRLVSVNRVAKVVKGGRRFGFSALVVVGDGKGRVGYGSGKAREVPEAVRKATEQAKRGMIRVPLRQGRTLHHDIIGHFGAGRVLLRTAPPGTGIIAGGPMRAVCEALGIHDVVGKSLGSTNPHNMVKATFDALVHVVSPRLIAAKRGRKVADILGRREGARRRREGGVGRWRQMVKITQIKSPIARPDWQERTLVALGLNKLHRSRVLADTPANRGRIDKVKHLLRVEPVESERVAGDEAERTAATIRARGPAASGSGAASAPASARPRARATRVPRRAAATRSRATSRAARCRSIGGCPSAASQNPTRGRVRRGQSRPPADGDRRRPARRRQDGRRRGADRRPAWCAGRWRASACSAMGELTAAVTIEVVGASKGAMAAVEQAGGKVVVLGAPGRSLSRPGGAGGTDGVGSRAARRQHQFRRLQQGHRAQEAAVVHARLPDRLPARHLHPAAGHRPGGDGADLRSSSAAASWACSTCSRAVPSSACRSSRSASCPTSRPRSSCS